MALIAFAQAWTSMRGKSMTFDELVYIPAGVSYVATGDYRLNPEHPPLAKVLAGLALLAEHVRFDTSDPAWQRADQWAVGQHFFDALGPETPRIVTVARFPSVLLTMLLVVLACAMGRALYGVEAGLLAAWFCAFSPNLLAHGRLATTEIGLTCFVLATSLAVLRMTERPSAGRIALAGVTLGLALVTKYSALLLVGLIPLWIGTTVLRREEGELPRWLTFERVESAVVRKGLGWVAAMAAVGVVAAFIASLAYQAPGRFDIYIRNLGLLYTNVHLDLPPYFAGTFHEGGMWSYFLVVFLIKTPMAFLVLLGVRVADQAVRRDPGVRSLLFLIVPALGWLFAMAVTALPLGVRYVLPMYPLLFVFGAGILTSPRFAEGKGRAMVIGLAVLFAASSLRAYPDYLPYVNILAENLGEPIEWLDDSNVDWGQDLPLLAEYLRERDIDDATIVPMAWYDPGLYGVVGTVRDPAEVLALLTAPNPPAGVYAVSAHLLTRARWGTPPAIDPLTDLIPVVVLGHSIFVFEVPGS